MRRLVVPALIVALLGPAPAHAQKYVGADGRLRVALAKQPFLPNGTSPGRPRWRGRHPGRPRENGCLREADGPSSEQLAALFEMIFSRYPKASAIGFATIPAKDEGGLSLAAVNRMIAGAITGLKARETRR